MEYRKLGRTDLNVSALCLGSMTWGEQNTEQEGFAQIAEPGEYFNFQIEKIKDDLWLIEASWFEI